MDGNSRLGLDIHRADIENFLWSEIFDRAKNLGKVVLASCGPYDFSYALMNSSYEYGRLRMHSDGTHYHFSGRDATQAIRKREREGTIGQSHGGLSFVFERNLPRQDFADFVGLHEFVEGALITGEPVLSFGSANEDVEYRDHAHAEACRIELRAVFQQDRDFIEQYARWIIDISKGNAPGKGYFGRAIKGFEPVVDSSLSPLEILERFKFRLEQRYHRNEEK